MVKAKIKAKVKPRVRPTTDDGQPYDDGESGHIIGRTKARYKPRQLAVHGHVFSHVAEDTNGDWIYRHD